MSREVSKLYRELAEIPIYTSAYYLPSNSQLSTISVEVSVRDHLRNIKRTLYKHILSTASDSVITPSQDSSDTLASVPSPSGKRLGVLRETTEGETKKRFVEVWFGDRLEAIKEVTKLHQAFYVQPPFFSLSFSKSESSFVYTAEAKAPEIDETSSEETAQKYRYVPDFGEGFTGKKKPALYLFHWDSNNVKCETEEPSIGGAKSVTRVFQLQPSLPEGRSIAFGQAAFAPDETTLYATGHDENERRLGLNFCWNRHIGIWRLVLPKDFPGDSDTVQLGAQCLTPPELSARSPRISDAAPGDPYTVVWLANAVGGPHASATSLYYLRSDEEKSRVLVDSILEPQVKGGFPGLYIDQLPSRPFLALHPETRAASYLVTHSIWGSRQTVLGISLSSGQLHDLTPGAVHTWKVLGTDSQDHILATRSAINSPNELLKGTFQNPEIPIDWTVIDKPHLSDLARRSLDRLESSILPIPNHFPTEVIILCPAGAKNLPLITFPHGGPHTTYKPDFDPSVVALALEGYTINLVNYSGTLGFGQRYVDVLMGRAGELDVQECYASAKYLVEMGLAQEGPGKQLVQGGSHGGFLSAHLIGQYPDFFSGAILYNAVLATGEIASVNDIPDWAFAEFGVQYGITSTITTEVFEKLQKASPINYIDAVKAPVLLVAGEIDRRVPSTQSINYYYALKGRRKNAELLMFPGSGHALDGVEVELVRWEVARDWFARYAKW